MHEEQVQERNVHDAAKKVAHLPVSTTNQQQEEYRHDSADFCFLHAFHATQNGAQWAEEV